MAENDINDEFGITFISNRNLRIPRVLGPYHLQKLIIEVQNCVVLATNDPQTQKKLAIKCIPVRHFKMNPQEFQIAQYFDDPHVLKALDSFSYPDINPRFYAIVMPRATSDLLDYLNYHTFLPEPVVYKIIKDSLEGLRTIHANNVWHRDIKLDNIFILSETRNGPLAAIADFGLAGIINDDVLEGLAVGTVEYAAPELLEISHNRLTMKKQAIYTNKVDLWGIGVVMFSLLCGKLPFDRSLEEDAIRLLNAQVSFEPLTDDPNDLFANFQSVSEEAKDLIRSLLSLDPAQRPSADEALRYEWFNMFQNETNEFEQENEDIFNILDEDEIDIN